MKMAVFWVVAPYSLVEVYQRFRGACCLHHQGDVRRWVRQILYIKIGMYFAPKMRLQDGTITEVVKYKYGHHKVYLSFILKILSTIFCTLYDTLIHY
jgi:hypothetical protein